MQSVLTRHIETVSCLWKRISFLSPNKKKLSGVKNRGGVVGRVLEASVALGDTVTPGRHRVGRRG